MIQRVRGVLVDGGKITLMKRTKGELEYYVFPGGGVEEGEDLPTALRREMKEELGIEVEVGNLMTEQPFVRNGVEQTEYFFRCRETGGKMGTGAGPEFAIGSEYEGSHEVEHISVDKLGEMNVLPATVRDIVVEEFGRK
jgi:ADP-ribose pyrophosphatase YjhB (NUDIX family)